MEYTTRDLLDAVDNGMMVVVQRLDPCVGQQVRHEPRYKGDAHAWVTVSGFRYQASDLAVRPFNDGVHEGDKVICGDGVVRKVLKVLVRTPEAARIRVEDGSEWILGNCMRIDA